MASVGSEVPPTPQEDQRREDGATSDDPCPEVGAPTDAKGPPKATGDSPKQEDGVTVCQFFLKGKCHFGHRCRFSHSEASLDDSGLGSADLDDKADQRKTEKHKRKVNKPTKPKYNEEKVVNKKPPMRRADDVISRILWDSSVDSSEFVVGYVDRFLGVLERPFDEFNWETNPCDCDYSTELALPRHRIQYFTYRGHRVWDRHTRTDRVFGSTGQSLAPPFGGEAEVKETNTGVQEQQEGVPETTTTSAEEPPAVCGQEESATEECSHSESTHLEEEGSGEMNIHTPDSTTAAPECEGNTSQGQQEARGACDEEEEEAAVRHESIDQISSSLKEEGTEETSEEWQENWEGNEDATSNHISESQSSPQEQRGEKRGSRPPKKRPTHFITFRANTPAILSGFQQLQEEITSALPSSAPHWQTSASLHVTMCLLVLPGPAEVDAAKEILRRFAQFDRNPPVALTFPVKLKHFGGRVLYLSPQPQLHLQQLNGGLQEAYRKEGLLHRDSYSPRYHLTLAKVEDREGDRIFEGVGDLKVGKGVNLGRLPINTLHLCEMGFNEVDGFYETVCSVTLR